jgi:transposase-like protein
MKDQRDGRVAFELPRAIQSTSATKADRKNPGGRVDETYVKVGGHWKYLFRAVDKHGRLIDFMLMDGRNTRAAHRFLGKR